ncbi:MAG: glutamine--fructose-6-phosphate transaminase (isomerizing) [Thermodesulfovibrio sp.]|nr:glutamine--fructose-6-phosphate transaminase (isomerizing) [Thermodesulfovibrio sp.]
MCGIVGYIGHNNALPILLDGMKRLEYRGYDSSGIAYRNGKGMEIYKAKGRINELEDIVPLPFDHATEGIGHTRWATHGAPSTINAHPHCVDGVAVVHNGIIENYRELKAELITEGHIFMSETDTEVIPHLISRSMKKGLPLYEAILESISSLRGSFALGIMSDNDPSVLYAAKQGSPLVVGYGEGEFFFASDIPAMLNHTKRFLFLEDGQICTLTAKEIDIHTFGKNGTPVKEPAIVEVDWTASMAEKDGYDHFMLKEIYEQPRAIADTLSEWNDCSGSLFENLQLTVRNTFGLRRLHIVACGTSYHAALIGRCIIEELARIPVSVEIASEYRYRQPIIEHDTIFISITQSGETADTLAAQKEAKGRGAKTMTICNVVGSTAAREADVVLYTRAGPEIGVASTKAFTSQVAALCLLAISLASNRGLLMNGDLRVLMNQLHAIPELIEKVLKKSTEIQELAATLTGARDFLYIGRGINYPIALEGALKLKEISYIHAEGYPGGEMKHGSIALIEDGMPVVALAPMTCHFDKILSNIEEVRARGARVIAITDEPGALAHKADDIITFPAAHPLFLPFVTVVPLQLLAYHIAVLKQCDVDRPRNLAKSVTVE